MTYATDQQAQAYFIGRAAASTWEAIPPDMKLRLLQTASDAMALYASIHGGWRKGIPPERLAHACCLEALALSDTARQMRQDLISQGVTATAIGGASESYGQGASKHVMQSTMAVQLLKPFVNSGGGVMIR